MDVKPDGPVEVWLSQRNLEVTCRVVREDESTTYLAVDSLSMRGAQREITGDLISAGFKPAGRWDTEVDSGYDDGPAETFRKFTPAKTEAVTVCRWCPGDGTPLPAHHPGGQVEHVKG